MDALSGYDSEGEARKHADVNYEEVNMDMSDEEGSDNEMFSCKAEYKAFKNQFNPNKGDKRTKEQEGPGMGEYDGGGGNGSGPAIEYGGAKSEYGGGPKTAEYGGGSEYGPSGNAGSVKQFPKNIPGGFVPGFRPAAPEVPSGPTPVKIDRDPKMYNDKSGSPSPENSVRRSGSKERRRSRSKSRERNRSRDRRRSRSGDRKKRRSRSGGRKRSRSRERHGHGKRRSRSREHHDRGGGRSPRRDGGGRGRGGWERRGGKHNDSRQREREQHQRNMEEQMKQAEEMGVAIPKYYKPGTFNPLSYAEQMQKRKMMWKKPGAPEGPENQSGPAAQEEKKDVPTASRSNEMGPCERPQGANKQPEQKLSFNKWEATNFGDTEANEKFRRLMGIRTAPKPEEVTDAPQNSTKIMNDLEKNYEVARLQTHRSRGVGLGFGGGEPEIPREVESGPPPVGPHMGTRPPPAGLNFRGPPPGILRAPPPSAFRGPPPSMNQPPPNLNFSEPPPRMSQPPPFPNHPTRPGTRPASSGISFVRKHY